jgi:glycosyltransferase involved in cell wall biosynthesis
MTHDRLRLLVIIPDRLSDLIRKGEITPRYYNPGELFDEVHILMVNDDRPEPAAVQRTVGHAKLYLYNLPKPSPIRTLGWQQFLLRNWVKSGIQLAKQIQPALIRVHGEHLNNYLSAQLKMHLGIPVIVSLHGNPDVDYGRLYHTPKQKYAHWQSKRLGEKYLHWIDHFIIVYSPIKPYLESRGLVNYSLIYNIVGIGAIPKADYSVQEVVKCLCVSRQNRDQKDQRPILQALSHVNNVVLHLYGNGDLHSELVTIAKTLKIENRVIFRKNIPNDELMREMHKFDIYIYNSINYEISKTVIEAALVGLPIIHNVRKPALSEELAGDYIFKVDNSSEGYQQGLLALINDESLRTELGLKARAHAKQFWDPKITEEQVVNLYKSFVPTLQ